MKQFNELGLAETVLQAVESEGYTSPTPIQSQVIPAMLDGRDILGTAQTGTGKTAAFVLPLLDKLAKGGNRPPKKSCGTLIMAPTRELAAQIAESVRTYGKFGRQSVAVIVGGVKAGPQIKAMARGVDILVATPGRLLDHVQEGVVRLDATSTVILDEADQMLDMGFIPDIRRIMARVPDERQTALLSATMPKPIRALANEFLTDPAEVSVAPVARPIEKIDQQVMLVDRSAKRRMLVDILGAADIERAIVFTRTKRGADRVKRVLSDAGLSAGAIHGNKTQNQRTQTLKAFKHGKINILVATDIAARGIDIDDVSHVVNYELPNIPESYVHRIGRTARAGKAGVAISLCDGTEREYLRDIEKLVGYSLNATGDGGTQDAPAKKSGGRGGRRHDGAHRNGGPRKSGARHKPGRLKSKAAANKAHKQKNGASRDDTGPKVEGDGDGLARMLGTKSGGGRRDGGRPRRRGGASRKRGGNQNRNEGSRQTQHA